ncbi:MAG: methyltransferase domain-containing protein [Candidatus Sumerlaeota bacterium]|nr:methyltransferase domain-containing protein [Candidatus Sumerlaeota bacterium]
MKLHLGCGARILEGWVNVDYALGAKLAKAPLFRFINRKVKIFDMDWDRRIYLHDLRKRFPWPDGSVEMAYSSHTLEHLTREEGLFFLKECHRVLNLGGIIRIVVPDLACIVADYQSGKLRADQFVESLGVLYATPHRGWKKRLAPFMEFPHRCMYDTPALTAICSEIGFECAPRKPFDSRIPDIQAVELEERTKDAVIVEGVRK